MRTETGLDGFTGSIIRPGDANYERARKLWNADIDRYPAIVAKCGTAADVASAIRYGRDRGIPLAVRSGGHSIPGLSMCDDGIVIDLSGMKGIKVDPVSRTALAEPGLIWREFDSATQAHGLATTGGEVSDTGVAGLTLGGGIGWLKRTCGLACDNLLEAEVVTADGEIVRASHEDNPDLFWGIRGGGGNFGVVTKFRFRLHEVHMPFVSTAVFDLPSAREVLTRLRDRFPDGAPDELSSMVALVTASAPVFPSEILGSQVAVMVSAWFGDPDRGEEMTGGLLRGLPAPKAAFTGQMPYCDLQRAVDDANPAGLRSYTRSEWLSGVSDDSIDALVAFASVPTSPLSQILLHPMGGRLSRVDPAETAFVYRRAAHSFTVVSMWDEDGAADRDAHVAWTREVWESVRPDSSGGAYVNHLGSEGADRVRDAYGDATYRRLQSVKDRWDPGNVFRLNQNIAPSAST